MDDIVERLQAKKRNATDEEDDALDEIELLRNRIQTLEQVIRSHGIPVKTYSGGVANYVMGGKK